MITRYRAQLDGVQLDSLDDSIYITDITEDAPKINVSAVTKPGDGLYVTRMRRESLQVTIKVMVRKRDPAARQLVIDKIAGWTNGTDLITSTRTGKHLRCVCVGLAAHGSALEWTEPISITMMAYEVPWWENVSAERFILSNVSQATQEIIIHGTDAAPLYCEIVNVSGDNINTLTIATGSSMLLLAGLAMAPNDALRISYDNKDRMKIDIGGRSCYNCLQPQSSDLLMVSAGNDVLNITADHTVNATLSYSPRWR